MYRPIFGPIRPRKHFDDTFSRFDIQSTRVTDGRTDGRNWRGIYAL